MNAPVALTGTARRVAHHQIRCTGALCQLHNIMHSMRNLGAVRTDSLRNEPGIVIEAQDAVLT
jgi:hypothetical protein